MTRRAAFPAAGLVEELLGLAGSRGWWFAGLCAQADPEVFFPEKGGSVREAKAVCARCPVRAQCLEYALAHDERHGVWGGLSEPERRRLAREAEAGQVERWLARHCEPAAAQPPAAAGRSKAVAEVDEVVVARLMTGRPVPGASRVEVAQAAIGLRRAGLGARRIAEQLGVQTRQVERWLTRHHAGQPVSPVAGSRPRTGGGER